MSTPVPTDQTELAREWRLEINMGTSEAPDWQLCPGVREFQPASEPNIEDASDYDSGGWAANEKTGQAWELSVTIRRKKSEDAKVYNTVHEAIRLAHFAYGAANKIHLRYMNRNGLPEAYEGKAIPNWQPSGGEYTALGETEITFTGDGPLTPIDNPLADEEETP
ncbi:phage tail protein [Streptomyces olivaceus]|uniref:phage tail tube protein n=1 Tax=Streptomyces olivaceus TaxID=47716 RepID=UPI001CCFE122|nr:phage tail protein [Streptomyces olivaceus]MBZ6250575.1 phage tail protein [Streptomyces olivaceus]